MSDIRKERVIQKIDLAGVSGLRDRHTILRSYGIHSWPDLAGYDRILWLDNHARIGEDDINVKFWHRETLLCIGEQIARHGQRDIVRHCFTGRTVNNYRDYSFAQLLPFAMNTATHYTLTRIA